MSTLITTNKISALELYRIELWLSGKATIENARESLIDASSREKVVKRYKLKKDTVCGTYFGNEEEILKKLQKKYPEARKFDSYQMICHQFMFEYYKLNDEGKYCTGWRKATPEEKAEIMKNLTRRTWNVHRLGKIS